MSNFRIVVSKEIIEKVREGYNKAADKHQHLTDLTRNSLLIFWQFKSFIQKGFKIVELGCGDGNPIGNDLIESNFDYLGIDLSDNQIKLAKKKHLKHSERFRQGEMLEFCKSQQDNSIGGIVSMFALFHLPRIHHVELFTEILRILVPGAPVIFTCHPGSWQGTEKDWLSAKEMYWSNFSNSWYDITLRELGFEFIASHRQVTEFNNEDEIQYFMLFKKSVVIRLFE